MSRLVNQREVLPDQKSGEMSPDDIEVIYSADTLKSCSRDIQFTCTSGECIPTSWKCDGNFDCEDRSDEATALCSSNTTGVPCEVDQGFFLCEDGLLCLNSTQVYYCSR